MNLKQYIEKYRSTFTGIAEKAGVSSQTISNIVKGKDFMLSVASKVAKATEGEVSVQDLIDYLEKHQKNTKKQQKEQAAHDIHKT